uniref:Uncharacterized protein n=1 Tax=Tanacetum cinerariifolium TaxID=118510 RepID=A0A699SGC6_TANCI|nr:hypothetical protein [Tanacetum cinerariifolium]
MDDEFGEPNAWDEHMSGLLLPTRGHNKILPVSEKGLYGLNKLFQNPFSIVNVGAMNNTLQNLQHRISWSVESNSFTCLGLLSGFVALAALGFVTFVALEDSVAPLSAALPCSASRCC